MRVRAAMLVAALGIVLVVVWMSRRQPNAVTDPIRETARAHRDVAP